MTPERSLILHRAVEVVFPVALVFAVFLLFAGHNAPGGGFVGGLVAGAAFVLRYVDGGSAEVRRAARVHPETLVGTGLTMAAITGAVGWIDGGAFLESHKLSVDLPLLGTAKTTTSLPFDIGVMLVVVGLVIMILRTLGSEAHK